ncbi:tRNA:m(4)X modification enzyme TRM13 homolog [Gigantopelta aegis]|uniref:tRNA:m(4)X modification enzyme TRM13 homolog n=1 Tax=Gigantopelta aegis TaxID=1735272 RepID=UPI001B88D167|nr:tRNA:m(4)X modification enzyme TRM13 homolog [Gigantopelta aegis]
MNCEPPENSCGFYLKKKRRFCKFRPNMGHKFCSEHSFVMGVQLERKRIPCPLDPKHTCYEHKLSKHLKKCNENQKQQNRSVFYSEGINAGNDEGDHVPDTKVTVQNVSEESLMHMIEKVNRLYEEHISKLESEVLTHSCLREELENPTFGIPALRHRKQQASIIGHLDKLGLLKDGNCFVELGAGKGQLSHWVQKALDKANDVAFILVDKGNVRNKFDLQHREGEGPVFERLRIDIEHLNLGKHLTVSESARPVVAMGKHLCGAATDLSLRCLLETMQPPDDDSEESAVKKPKLEKSSHLMAPAGIVIALCCHHRCTWRAYVGKHFMRQCGFSSRDFQLLTSMSSWATCTWKGWKTLGAKTDEKIENGSVSNDLKADPEEHVIDVASSHHPELRLSEEDREKVGRKCKRLIDYGRVKYLLDHNMDGYLRQYIDQQLTPENIILIARQAGNN